MVIAKKIHICLEENFCKAADDGEDIKIWKGRLVLKDKFWLFGFSYMNLFLDKISHNGFEIMKLCFPVNIFLLFWFQFFSRRIRLTLTCWSFFIGQVRFGQWILVAGRRETPLVSFLAGNNEMAENDNWYYYDTTYSKIIRVWH